MEKILVSTDNESPKGAPVSIKSGASPGPKEFGFTPPPSIGVFDTNKVIIDRCPKHHGLWFDKGELEKIIKMNYIDKASKVLNLLKDIFGKN